MSIFQELYNVCKAFYESKKLILDLSINDFKYQFLGSYLGIFWAVLRPLIFVAVIWFIFSAGFKKTQIENEIPFILYLLTGYIPWIFFSDAVSGGMSSILNNRFLVKKVNFKIGILPIVKIVSAFYLHAIFISIMILVLLTYGYFPNLYWIQLPFYILCLSILLSGLGWLTASLRVFTKDIAELVRIILQIGFWVSPIFWSLNDVPQKYVWILKLNPMVYIIEGYRNTFINKIWFWEANGFTLYFITSLVILTLSIIIFKRLRPHLSDVL
jgi:ABC-type polysaccharide/polyol phosphate export permease